MAHCIFHDRLGTNKDHSRSLVRRRESKCLLVPRRWNRHRSFEVNLSWRGFFTSCRLFVQWRKESLQWRERTSTSISLRIVAELGTGVSCDVVDWEAKFDCFFVGDLRSDSCAHRSRSERNEIRKQMCIWLTSANKEIDDKILGKTTSWRECDCLRAQVRSNVWFVNRSYDSLPSLSRRRRKLWIRWSTFSGGNHLCEELFLSPKSWGPLPFTVLDENCF